MWSLKCEITVIGSILVSLTDIEILYLTALVQRLQPCPAQAWTRQQQSLHLLTLPETSHKEPSTTPSASLTQVPGPLAEYGSSQFPLLSQGNFSNSPTFLTLASVKAAQLQWLLEELLVGE